MEKGGVTVSVGVAVAQSRRVGLWQEEKEWVAVKEGGVLECCRGRDKVVNGGHGVVKLGRAWSYCNGFPCRLIA